jgi:anti-sigma B factor antagonist
MPLETNSTPPVPDVDTDSVVKKGRRTAPLQLFVSGEATTRLIVAGELDGATAVFLSEQLRQLVADLAGDLTMDIGLITFIDSTGLSLLISLHKQVRASGRTLTVADPTPMARRLFEITGLDQVLKIEPAPLGGPPPPDHAT